MSPSRSPRSARQAGSRFEREIADYLAANWDDRIDRRVKTGAKDRGDIGGFRNLGKRVVIECKNVVSVALGTWVNEAEIERGNDDANAAMVIHKRVRHGAAGDQYVTMTLADLLALISGRPKGEFL